MRGYSSRSPSWSFPMSKASHVVTSTLLAFLASGCGEDQRQFRGYECPEGTSLSVDTDGQDTWMSCLLPGRVAHGPGVSWYENGNLRTVANYFDGRWHGSMVHYHKNGQTAQVSRFWEGRHVGPLSMFDERGELTRIVLYDEHIPDLQLSDREYQNGEPLETTP